MAAKEHFIVIGGGPVGCTAALFMSKLGHAVTLYEGRSDVPTDPEQSYPIGVNSRGLHALDDVAPCVSNAIRRGDNIVNSWEVYAGARRVALLPSGVVHGTSRGQVNLGLWRACANDEGISLRTNHRLRSIDFATKTLHFDVYDPCGGDDSTTTTTTPSSSVTIDASNSRVIGADGVNSVVRAAMQIADPDNFTVRITPWTNEYRVLFAEPGVMTEGLDPRVHYILGCGYAATIENDARQQWTLVTVARDTDDIVRGPARLVYARESTEANVSSLREWISSSSPQFAPLVSDEECSRYFSRRTYRGAIVECSKFHHDEWIVLLGDAAHSVLPPTGEGINSGLEDCEVLGKCVRDHPIASFSTYQRLRYPDIAGLWEYAYHLNRCPSFVGERIARTMFMIIEGMLHPSVSDSLFGALSAHRPSYSEIMIPWMRKRRVLMSAARLLWYPIAGVWSLLMIPKTLLKFATRDNSAPKMKIVKSIV
ncbi:hypothetical protein ACHAXA_006052 [Cyclostephanos tholiformis]|uniref:FAD-binding domain-containing protein n=1 Tax=Cyclostephanos tholiformis TaxID=382380 RepID=A0ABD3SBA9_9STRA